MHFSNAQIRKLARATLALVLFAQGVVAAQTCGAREADPVQAFAPAMNAGMAGMHDEEAMPCHEQPGENKNACLAHCTQANQISADQAAPVFMPATAVVLVLDVPAIRASTFPRFRASELVLNGGPPIPIRFCTFLI